MGRLALSLSIGLTASCATPVEEQEIENIGSVEQDITGWVTLGLLNGWTANAGNAPRVAKAGNVIDDHNERNPRPRAHRFERNDARGHSQPGHSKAIHVLGRRFVRALRPS